jgi:phosphofructokinase-like protein
MLVTYALPILCISSVRDEMSVLLPIKNIGISTGGGDCPGLNAVIRAVVKSGILQYGWRVIGIEDGFDGLIWPDRVRELTLDDVAGLLPKGGTILGTTNRGDPLAYRLMDKGRETIHDFSHEVIENARTMGLDAMIVVGGDGTMKIAMELSRKGLKLVGVPKTIDNDLAGTEVSFGFDTALHTAMEAIDKVHTSAESHHRVMVIEVMGRRAGWIGLQSGLAAGADVILIPEIPFVMDKVVDCISRRKAAGKHFTIVVVAEGIDVSAPQPADEAAFMVSRSGRAGYAIGDCIARRTQHDTRVTVLGHIQRGGSPSPFDRILCTRFGVAATDLVARGDFGRMVALKAGKIESVDLAEAVRTTRCIDPQCDMVRMARAIGVCFGD